ncbi:CsbD family protein [uncultured Sphingomonas sp.]|uniref:CsbD family protein n=1 Tax=uncultured Sphingomonas sp. TaxID=158754 RepID=UPI0025F098AB|nr:CsbD family protein [uncultured Sphingomonas sp.]
MNIDTLNGAATDLGGKLKEGIGAATGNEKLRGQGKADQLGGKVQQYYGDAKDAVETTVRPLIDQARQFARERPFLAATLAGVAAIAVVNTLRGE